MVCTEHSVTEWKVPLTVAVPLKVAVKLPATSGLEPRDTVVRMSFPPVACSSPDLPALSTKVKPTTVWARVVPMG